MKRFIFKNVSHSKVFHLQKHFTKTFLFQISFIPELFHSRSLSFQIPFIPDPFHFRSLSGEAFFRIRAARICPGLAGTYEKRKTIKVRAGTETFWPGGHVCGASNILITCRDGDILAGRARMRSEKQFKYVPGRRRLGSAGTYVERETSLLRASRKPEIIKKLPPETFCSMRQFFYEIQPVRCPADCGSCFLPPGSSTGGTKQKSQFRQLESRGHSSASSKAAITAPPVRSRSHSAAGAS